VKAKKIPRYKKFLQIIDKLRERLPLSDLEMKAIFMFAALNKIRLGARLKMLREEANLSQLALERLSSVDNTWIWRVENEIITEPDRQRLADLVPVLQERLPHIDVAEILGVKEIVWKRKILTFVAQGKGNTNIARLLDLLGAQVDKLMHQWYLEYNINGYEEDSRKKLVLAAKEDGVLPVDLEFNPLTKREVEVLELIAQGKSREEISTALGGISERTVGIHTTHIYSKLGVDGNDRFARLKAVKIAQAKGFISRDIDITKLIRDSYGERKVRIIELVAEGKSNKEIGVGINKSIVIK